MTISTRGNDTIAMASVLQTLQNVIRNELPSPASQEIESDKD